MSGMNSLSRLGPKCADKALASVSRRLIEAQEQERTRIARELHDDISQRLALLAVGIEQVKDELPKEATELRRRMGGLWSTTLEIATSIQSLSHELHSAKLKYLGIVTAVKGFCKEFGERQKVDIGFKSHDVPTSLPNEIALCLFRVVQEALNNSAKHSGAQQIEVQLWATPDEIHLTVSDCGAGFELEAARKGRGLGLISMQERLQLVKGTLSIKSQPKRGTTIHARVSLSSGSNCMRTAEQRAPKPLLGGQWSDDRGIPTRLGVQSVAELTRLTQEAGIFPEPVRTFPKGQ